MMLDDRPIAAAGDRVAWVVGQNVLVATDGGGTLVPQTLATGQPRPADISIDPGRGDVYWTNGVSGDRDAGGQLIKDGSVWRWNAASGLATAIATQVVPMEIDASLGSTYWADSENNEIKVFSPATGAVSQFIGNQAGANSVRAVSSAMTFELLFDGVESATSIQPYITKLHQLSDIDPGLKRPSKVKVVYGSEGRQ